MDLTQVKHSKALTRIDNFCSLYYKISLPPTRIPRLCLLMQIPNRLLRHDSKQLSFRRGFICGLSVSMRTRSYWIQASPIIACSLRCFNRSSSTSLISFIPFHILGLSVLCLTVSFNNLSHELNKFVITSY